MSSLLPLVIATRNVRKLRELRQMLRGYPFLDVLSLFDFPDYVPLPENQLSLEANAVQKAVHAATTLHHMVIADDTGLIVPALKGAPGVYTARYAGQGVTEEENGKKLLEAMKGIEDPYRQAYYECWLALASPDGLAKCVCGICEGNILAEEEGVRRFGYDSLFVKHEYGKSFSELDESLKNLISHRRKAFDKLHPFLEALKSSSHGRG